MSKSKPKDNIVLIIADCLRNDHAYDPNIMPFLNKFKDKYFYSKKAYTNATSTHFAMPTMLTGYMPFEVTDKIEINSKNINRYLPKVYQQGGYKTIGITTNVVTSRAFGYKKYYDFYEDFWTDITNINEKRKDILRLLPHKIRLGIIDPIIKKLGSLIRPPSKVKESMRGERILESLKQRSFQKSGNFIFLHFMEPHSPYISEEAGIPLREVNRLNLKLITQKHRLTKDEIKRLKTLYTFECKRMDKILEQTISFLKDNLDWVNTKIIITSDHGESFGESGYMEHPSITINSRHHAKVPLITKGLDLNTKDQYWTVDLYKLLNSKLAQTLPTYKICVAYDSVKKIERNVIKKYRPTGYFDLEKFKKIKSTKDLPYIHSSRTIKRNFSI